MGIHARNFRSKISPTICGFAFPFDNFITCPLRKFSEAALPALKSAAGFGLATITSSQIFSTAVVSVNCSIPLSCTIALGLLPLANISAKTSLPCLLLIFPESINATSSFSSSGSIGHCLIVLPDAESALCRSFRIQFAIAFGLLQAHAAFSK